MFIVGIMKQLEHWGDGSGYYLHRVTVFVARQSSGGKLRLQEVDDVTQWITDRSIAESVAKDFADRRCFLYLDSDHVESGMELGDYEVNKLDKAFSEKYGGFFNALWAGVIPPIDTSHYRRM